MSHIRPKKGILRGGKLNQRHSTYLRLAQEVIKRVKGLPQVRKITSGHISYGSRPPQGVVFRSDPRGVKVLCYDKEMMQSLILMGATVSDVDGILGDLKR